MTDTLTRPDTRADLEEAIGHLIVTREAEPSPGRRFVLDLRIAEAARRWVEA